MRSVRQTTGTRLVTQSSGLGGLKGAARSRLAWSSEHGYYFAGAVLRPRNILRSDRDRAEAFYQFFTSATSTATTIFEPMRPHGNRD